MMSWVSRIVNPELEESHFEANTMLNLKSLCYIYSCSYRFSILILYISRIGGLEHVGEHTYGNDIIIDLRTKRDDEL